MTMTREGKYAGVHSYAITLHAAPRPRSVRVDGRAPLVRSDAASRTVTFVVPSNSRRIAVTP